MSNDSVIDRAMLLAAGLGTRMRPLTEHTPKPLIAVAGKPLIGHALDRLRKAGVRRVVMNVHWLADQLEEWARAQTSPPEIMISDERAQLLETGGGLKKALGLLGRDAPFFVVNTDSIWLDTPHGASALQRLAAAWDAARMDALLLLCPLQRAMGHGKGGDFMPAADKDMNEEPAHAVAIRRATARERAAAPVFTGIYVVHPRLFAAAPDDTPRFSMNVLFDAALSKGRLFGLWHQGLWLHVGTPQAITEAEQAMRNWPAATS